MVHHSSLNMLRCEGKIIRTILAALFVQVVLLRQFPTKLCPAVMATADHVHGSDSESSFLDLPRIISTKSIRDYPPKIWQCLW